MIIGMTEAELRVYALGLQAQHDPKQQDHSYDRCEHCHFTRHPCDPHELATAVLELLTERNDLVHVARLGRGNARYIALSTDYKNDRQREIAREIYRVDVREVMP